MKVLITGATGFVGERYVQHLATTRSDIKLHFCGRQLEAGNALAAATGSHFFRGDLLDMPFVQHICKDIDGVVHCAGRAGAWGDYELYYRDNVTATENLLRACLGAGVRRFVNLSSPSIYFDFRDRLNVMENFLPDRFADNYARTKYQAETRVANAHSDQLRTLSLRPRMVLGPGDRNFFPRMIDMQRSGQLRRIGDGTNIVSATHIDNLLQAMDCALFGPDSVTGDVYNIADTQPYSIWGMVDRLLKAVELPPVTRQVAYSAAMLGAGAVETGCRLLRREQEPRLMRLKVALLARSFTLNTDKARRKLGYRPAASVDTAIAEFAQDWLRQHPPGAQIAV
ncbi:MAG TPA: NAD-dependent epimerase/dehydratase family protein [Dongiaceae bacterium]|nr:NAD-dependent epimerase/dehydratase family protein [Dongiaceae bacterium]